MNRTEGREAHPDPAITSILTCSDATSDLAGVTQRMKHRWPHAVNQQQDVAAGPHRVYE